MNLWNDKNVSIPPINTYKATDNHIDIKHLRYVFQEGKKFFEDQRYMKAEFVVMSRIVYRMKQKFRSAKDFKALEKVHKAVNTYLKINIAADLQSFINLIPYKYKEETYLPNKSIVDYILVRLQGLVKLMHRIVETCKITAYLYEKRMHIGHFWKIGFIIFAMVSRIYVLAKHTAKFMCDFYIKVLPFSKQLKNNGSNFLPTNYVLPTDLQQWLNVDWLDVDEDIQIIETPEISSIMQIFDMVDDDDDIQFCDEYIMVDDNEEDVDFLNQFKNQGNFRTNRNINELRGFDMDEDFGEVIELNDESLINRVGADIEENTESEIINVDDSQQVINIDDSQQIIDINDSLQMSEDGIIGDNDSNRNDVVDLTSSFMGDPIDVGEVIEIDTIIEDNRTRNKKTRISKVSMRNNNNKKMKQLINNNLTKKLKQKVNKKMENLKKRVDKASGVGVSNKNRTEAKTKNVTICDFNTGDDIENVKQKASKKRKRFKKGDTNSVSFFTKNRLEANGGNGAVNDFDSGSNIRNIKQKASKKRKICQNGDNNAIISSVFTKNRIEANRSNVTVSDFDSAGNIGNIKHKANRKRKIFKNGNNNIVSISSASTKYRTEANENNVILCEFDTRGNRGTIKSNASKKRKNLEKGDNNPVSVPGFSKTNFHTADNIKETKVKNNKRKSQNTHLSDRFNKRPNISVSQSNQNRVNLLKNDLVPSNFYGEKKKRKKQNKKLENKPSINHIQSETAFNGVKKKKLHKGSKMKKKGKPTRNVYY